MVQGSKLLDAATTGMSGCFVQPEMLSPAFCMRNCRGKLRRVFGLEAGAAELTLGRRLRVPPL